MYLKPVSSQFKTHRLYRDHRTNVSSNNPIELPEEIDQLIDNKAFRPKYRKLVRDGHLTDLLELATMAGDKDKPSHWFTRVCRKAVWEKTLAWLAKARKVAQLAAEVAKRLDAPETAMKAILKACWRNGPSVLRKAITAEETGRDKFLYFCWLTKQQKC